MKKLVQHIRNRLRVIGFIIDKEFRQIFRSRLMLFYILLLPIIQVVILVHAATFDIKQINIVVVDNDLSSFSRRLTQKFTGSGFFKVIEPALPVKDGEEYLIKNLADAVIIIPNDFERNLFRENREAVQININAINIMVAGMVNFYSLTIINSFNKEIFVEIFGGEFVEEKVNFNVEYSKWYNPRSENKIFMFPGILIILITNIGMFLTAWNIVKEKEVGTIEQINVTPVMKYQFLAGKLIPFWIIGMFELAFGLTLGKILFNIPTEGSLALLFLCGGVYLLVALGFGLFLSSISNRQQQLMFLTWFFMLVFILMGGLFTPVESMPEWARILNYANPFAYFTEIMRLILLKGSEFADIAQEFYSLTIYAIIILSLATAMYSKKTA